MLTPFNVMLGIWPPGENWPLTLVGLSASLNSPGPRSVWPRGSMSGRTMPELSHRSLNSPFHSAVLSDQVPTPLPGLPLESPTPGLLHAFQPWQLPTHIDAWFMFSKVASNSFASPICCLSFPNSVAAAANDCAAPACP